jgi:uncharacterized protein
MTTTHLLYLHGFRSSPASAKARQMARLAESRPGLIWWCPQLPPSPQQAMQDIMQGISSWPASMAVMGSSLGGFYATSVAERRRCKAVVLNPAVDPARDLHAYIGEQTVWQRPEEKFFFKPEFVSELKALHCGPLKSPENYLAVIAKGDEVLDWHEMAGRYAGANLRLREGGDHALSDFKAHLPAILEFLGLNA